MLTQIGVYSSSKAALNTLAGTLRLELAPFGVSVVSVMLGRVLTPFHANEPEFKLPPGSRYTPIESTIARWSRGEPGPKAGPLNALVAELVDDVLVTQSTARIWKGPWAGLIQFCTGWLPGWLVVSPNSLSYLCTDLTFLEADAELCRIT